MVLIKSGDGRQVLERSSRAALVGALHARGIKVCAWQFVYGRNPQRGGARRGRGGRSAAPTAS